jgi:large subunit ribosomal protein L35
MRIGAHSTSFLSVRQKHNSPCEARVCFNSEPVPKMKTHSGAKKRFRKTATGKLRGRRAYSSHILEKKSPKRKRRMARPVEIAPSDVKTVRNLLGGGK